MLLASMVIMKSLIAIAESRNRSAIFQSGRVPVELVRIRVVLAVGPASG
jgi:hypothetical protein